MVKPSNRRLLQLGFLGLVVLFFVVFLWGIDYDVLATLDVDWPLVAAASALSLGFRYWGVLIWRTILRDLGARQLPRFRVLADIYAKAWMARYVPGTVPWIAGKIYMARNIGVSRGRLAVASLLEGGMQVIAVTAVSTLLIGFDTRLDVVPAWLQILTVLLGFALLALLSPPVFNKVIRTVYEKIRKTPASTELRTNGRAVARSFALYGVGAFISGTSYFLFASAIVGGVSWDKYLFLVGAFNLSGAVGTAVVFAPSGLGAREGVQLVLLSAVFPKEIALVITIASRLWSAAVDVLFFLLAAAINRVASGRSAVAPG
jgi:glycosyltransferase 2 family protein